MTQAEFREFCEYVYKRLQELAPYRTGNLALNSIKLEYVSPNEALVYVDVNIAPYMPYTNEPWVSLRWNGHKNPNEKWFDRAIATIAKECAKKWKGKVKKLGG